MNKCLLAMTAVAAICATGCISVHKNDGGESDLRTCRVKDRVYEKFEVSDKTVSATETMNCVLGLIRWGQTASHIADQAEFSGFGPVAAVKNGAYAKACEAAGCDQIAAARYTITKEDYFVFAKYKAEITGYPVKLSGVEIVPPCCKACGPCLKAGGPKAGCPMTGFLKK